jgi:hypothetical protein
MKEKQTFNKSRATRLEETSNQYFGFGLFIVESSTQIGAGTEPYRWLYTIRPAAIKNATFAPDFSKAFIVPNSPQIQAISVSELGNSVNASPNRKYSYGIAESDLVGSIVPVKIPDGTPVIAMPYRTDSGVARYIIINTQAITGAC